MSYTQYNYNSQPREQPKCNYCNTPIKFTKDKETNRWIRYNMDGSPHTRQVCDNIKTGATPTNQRTGITSGPEMNTTAPANTGAIDPHLNSILIKVSDLAKAVMELKQLLFNQEKMAQTNATVIDNMAQKIELILQKTGYPEPKQMVKVDPVEYKCKNCNKIYPDFNSRSKELCGECVKTIAEESFDKREKDKEVINPMRLPKDALEENIAQNIEKHENNSLLSKDGKSIDIGKVVSKLDEVEDRNKSAQIFKEQVLPAMEKTVPQEKGKPWTPISEMFTCDSCKTKSANGFEKYGTKICPDCNNEFENTAQQSGDIEKEEFDKLNTEYDY